MTDQTPDDLAGMTNAKIGRASGIGPVIVSQLLTGAKTPSLAALAAMAKVSGGQLSVRYDPPRKLSGKR